ncbi:hypothetical protein CKM354_000754400 [Cercospora kikuchii]|uniref:Uncharacterized protein n=1 Tax=Cercospora kikuchii TaxID=84275 RepID=A0A9P3CK69_9PEZI|nr:uncharacterized protein CKM354_000754400 [Cercospora kikuchii]GIZ44344.1 hypothetical protein CKM354_000754400 [Cercospora kikuchii]
MSTKSSMYSTRDESSQCTRQDRPGCSSWIWEVLSFSVSFLCMGAIVVLLANLNNKPLPNMGFLTLNGIVSTLAGISKAALILPISEAISQLKWQWFWNVDRPRPISDFQIYDSASRGPWGSLCLLARPRLAHLSSLGAILTVVALAIEPFFQLVPSYPVRMMPTAGGLATVPVASLFTQIERDPIDLNTVTAGQGLKGATYDGLFGSSTNKQVDPSCSTGNCTWTPYTSLAVCSACTNLTDMLREIPPADGVSDITGWGLPNGNTEYGASATYMVQGNAAVLPQKNGGQDSGNWTIAYSNMQNFTLFTAQSWYWAPLTGNTSSPPHVSECILHFCLRTYNASVNDGIFSESLISQWPDPLQPLPKSITDQWGFRLLREMIHRSATDGRTMWWQHAPDNITEAEITLTSPQVEDQVYHISWLTMFGLRNWLTENWSVATSDQDTTSDVAQVMYNAYTGPSRATVQPEDTSAALAAVAAMPGPAGLWSDVAESMTRHIRDQASGQQSAHGVAYAAQTFVSVQWEWIILPISLLILTLAFVSLTVAQSVEKEIPLWKSNSMPSLVYSFDETTSHSISGHGRTGEDMEQHAKAFEMAMRATSGSLKLRARPRNTYL